MQNYSNELLQAMVDGVTSLTDIVGYHFPFCPAYLADTPQPCTCGMQQLHDSRGRCRDELDQRRGLIPPAIPAWAEEGT